MLDKSIIEALRAEPDKKQKWFIPEGRLDEKQLRILNSKEGKLIIEGSAGSGKTLIALHRLHRIIEEGKETVLFVIYTKTLKGYIKAGVNQLLEEGSTNVDIVYVYELNKEGIGDKIKKTSYDYVIIDEVQDIEKDILRKIVSLANKDIILFGDDEQQIYYDINEGISISEVKEEVLEIQNLRHEKLKFNYRVPKDVIKFSQLIINDSGGLLKNSKNDTGAVTINEYEDIYKEMQSIYDIIKSDSLTDVAILYPRNVDVDIAKKILNEIDSSFLVEFKSDKGDTLDFETPLPKILTFHSSKGLEFEHVFIPSCNRIKNFNPKQWRKAFYVASTRTNHTLYLSYYDNKNNDAMIEIEKYKSIYSLD